MPEDRVPHCRWEITIDDSNETLDEPPITTMTRPTTAATFEFPPMRDGTPHLPPRTTQVWIGQPLLRAVASEARHEDVDRGVGLGPDGPARAVGQEYHDSPPTRTCYTPA